MDNANQPSRSLHEDNNTSVKFPLVLRKHRATIPIKISLDAGEFSLYDSPLYTLSIMRSYIRRFSAVQGFLSIFGNITSIISQLLIIVATALVTYFLTRRGERKKKVRESIEELYRLLSQVDIWMKVTQRYLYKELDKMDYYRPVIPGEYLEDFT